MLQGILKEIAPIILNVAPTIATALGGPLAGGILSVLCETFGVHKKDPEDLVNKVLADVPAAEKKIGALENSHKCWLKDLMPDELEWSGKVKWDKDKEGEESA